jgi:hypothetical protein
VEAFEKLATVLMGIYDLVLSPDGRKFAFHGSATQPVRSYSQPGLWVMDAATNAQPKNLTADYDYDMGSSVFGDNAAPRGGNGRTLSTRKTSGKADCGAAVHRGSRTETARKLSEQGLTAFVWSR